MGAGAGVTMDSTVFTRGWRVGVLGLVAGGAVCLAALLPRLAQDPAYHRFADPRALGGVPNAANVLSNVAFLLAGLAGLAAIRAGPPLLDRRERAPWLTFFAAVALVGPGSAWYHLAPSNGSLVWDRLPMAVAFAAFLVAVLAERIGPAAARLLAPAAVAAAATVAYWFVTEAMGRGDLRPYALAQYAPLLLVPLVLLLYPARYSHGAAWLAGLALYGLAKAAELLDAPLLAANGIVGGHAVKHLLAAAAVGVFAWMLRVRSPSVR